MQNKLYVGNLSYQASEGDLQTLFGKHGTVSSVNIIRDSYSGQSKGFAFIEMASSTEAEAALQENGAEFMGRNLTVSEARPQTDRGPRRSGGGGGGGGRPDRGRGGFGGGSSSGGGGGRRRY